MELSEKKIKVPTTGTYDFERLILGGDGKYVDKTDLLYNLALSKTDAQYFISRPRRFGKSLMLSTLKAMFEGKRELFKGLAIDSLPWEGWDNPRPVLLFDMSRLSPSEGRDAMEFALAGQIREAADAFGVGPIDVSSIGFAFDELIRRVAATSRDGKVVVLVDEYDAPMTSVLDDLEYLRWMRSFLHDFYCRLKVNSGIIRFLMMTGVTKLTKLSVFSGLNHLTDLTMDPRFATLLGYTPDELDGQLRENVEVFAQKNGMDFAAAKKTLISWYDGYRFSPRSEAKVCNPVSLGSALKTGELKNYWEATGHSTMIVNRIKAAGEIPADLNGMAVTQTQLDVCDAETMPLPALLYQGGYLTLSEIIDGSTFRLGMPNNEIANSLSEGYVASLLGNGITDWTEQLAESRAGLRAKGVETLLKKNLKAAFAAVPHEWKIECEKEAKRYFLLFMKLIGSEISGERQSARGRADAILKDKSGVYVFEFKYGKTAEESLQQAREKDYAGPWLDGEPPVYYVGVNYDPAKRGIDDPLVEPA
jgi:hypothetical protein